MADAAGTPPGEAAGAVPAPVDTGKYVVAKPDNIPAGDFANYLCTYGARPHQPRVA